MDGEAVRPMTFAFICLGAGVWTANLVLVTDLHTAHAAETAARGGVLVRSGCASTLQWWVRAQGYQLPAVGEGIESVAQSMVPCPCGFIENMKGRNVYVRPGTPL